MNYAGNPVFPAELPLVDDGIVPDGSELNVPIEALADRTAYLKDHLSSINADALILSFTSTVPGVWTAGPYDRRVELVGYGGGGGGGGGGAGSSTVPPDGYWYSSGGGGGGASLLRTVVVDVTPGESYQILVGAGGAPGAGGTDTVGGDATAGGDGDDTVFVRVSDSEVLARFKGGKGGARGGGIAGTSAFCIVPGGSPTFQPRPNNQFRAPFDQQSTTFCFGPGFGGDGTSKQTVPISRQGADSIEGYSGGGGGSYGASATFPGGGAGGGGAAGPGGDGYQGLNGGDGKASGVGDPGASYVGFIDAPTGAGGGGGGGGGSGPSAGGNGSGGSPGFKGNLTLRAVG